MPRALQIALVGDYDPAVTAHQAIPPALALAATALGRPVEPRWVPTETITDSDSLTAFDGVWCVPASPYRSMAGALRAIRFAREASRPFLGTCGGFQHAVLEYARTVLGWADADHGETARAGARLVIAPLACALVEVSNAIRLAQVGPGELGPHCGKIRGLEPEGLEICKAPPGIPQGRLLFNCRSIGSNAPDLSAHGARVSMVFEANTRSPLASACMQATVCVSHSSYL